MDFLARSSVPLPARFVFPDLGIEPGDPVVVAHPPPPQPMAELRFDETELARMLAGTAALARAGAADEARLTLDHATARALDRLEATLEQLAMAGAAARAASQAMALRLAKGFLHAVLDRLGEHDRFGLLAGMLDEALAAGRPKGRVEILVAPALAPRMQDLLAHRFVEQRDHDLVVVARPELAPGELLLSWQDGWAEWSFERWLAQLRCRLDELVPPASARPAPDVTPLPAPSDPHPIAD